MNRNTLFAAGPEPFIIEELLRKDIENFPDQKRCKLLTDRLVRMNNGERSL